MEKGQAIGRKLRALIPGGAHTYSKGDDQWPELAPKCIERGKGCYVWDPDGGKYIDWSMGLTSVAFGHAHAEINRAACEAMELGHNFQRPAVIEAQAAEDLLSFLGDRGEMVKFSKNGSTVTTAAVKLARAYTGREVVGLCAEHPFFSYDDWFIGSTRCPAGVPDPIRRLTAKFSFNDLESVRAMFAAQPGKIAAVILEPVKFDRPAPGFLQGLRDECKKHGTVLVMDEMVTGFKWHHQGAAKYYGVDADLYTWGKGMANGHSVCALTGRRDIMQLGGIEHDKPRVFLTSTTHGAEIPQLAAMMKTLEILRRDPGVLERNWSRGKALRQRLSELVKRESLEGNVGFQGEDCFFVLTLGSGGIHKLNVAKTYLLQELVTRGQLFQGLFYITAAHDDAAMDATVKAWSEALPKFKRFIEKGARSELIGDVVRPVFRAFNSCECLSPKDCQACAKKLESR